MIFIALAKSECFLFNTRHLQLKTDAFFRIRESGKI